MNDHRSKQGNELKSAHKRDEVGMGSELSVWGSGIGNHFTLEKAKYIPKMDMVYY